MNQPLPIETIRSRFCQLLPDRHLVVEASTGSGKSTCLPLWAARQGRVLVVEPRRVACVALAGFLAEQRGASLGEQVGYAIRFASHYRASTAVVFVTPGIALRWLAEDALAGFDTVILDEFHERRWDTDLLLALLRERGDKRLVLTSATVDGERLASYLEAERLTAGGRLHPVSVIHLAEGIRQMPDLRGIEGRVRRAVALALEESDGDLLVFLPGRREIALCQQALAELQDAALLIVPLHASVPKEVQARALAQQPVRRVILATNVAETSLTIPGVTAVIDTGLERRTHQRNGRTVLGLYPISMASAEQRKGRAGRLQPGRCYRLYGEHAPLDALTPPELHREELVEPMLAAAVCGQPLDSLRFIEPLPQKALTLAAEKLRAMHAIDGDGKATTHGKALYPLPIDTLFAHLITAMPTEPLRLAMADLAAALSLSQRLWRLPTSETALKALKAWQPLDCDATTLIQLIRTRPPVELDVDSALLKEARILAGQLRSALGLAPLPPPQPEMEPFWRDSWLDAVIEASPELAFVRRSKRRQALGNGYTEVTVGRESRFADEAEAAMVFDQHSLPGKGVKQTLNLATCMAPVTLKQLTRRELGTLQPGRVTWEAGQPQMLQERCYAGRVIGCQWVTPRGETLCRAMAELILAGRLMPGLGARLEDDVAAYRLYLAMEQAPAADLSLVESVEQWLAGRLAELGVEQYEDMALIEEDDLHFDGIPAWQRPRFDELYPRRLALGNLFLDVSYDAEHKRVTVEYTDGLRKGDPRRRELPRWSGWKVQYKKASRVVEIT